MIAQEKYLGIIFLCSYLHLEMFLFTEAIRMSTPNKPLFYGLKNASVNYISPFAPDLVL